MNQDRTTVKMDTAISSEESVLSHSSLIVLWFTLVLRSGFCCANTDVSTGTALHDSLAAVLIVISL